MHRHVGLRPATEAGWRAVVGPPAPSRSVHGCFCTAGIMALVSTCFRQLVSGAETLNLVAEILKSIDRITEVKDEVDS